LESEFEVVDDIVYDFMIFDKSNDFHFCTAVGAEKGVYFNIGLQFFHTGEKSRKKGDQFIKNLLAILLINIYTIVRNSEHIND